MSGSSGCASARRSPARTGSTRRRLRRAPRNLAERRRGARLGGARRMAKGAVAQVGAEFVYAPANTPVEILRRIVRRAVLDLATEGRRSFAGASSTTARDPQARRDSDASRRALQRRVGMALPPGASAQIGAIEGQQLGPGPLGLLLVVGLTPGHGPAMVRRGNLDLRRSPRLSERGIEARLFLRHLLRVIPGDDHQISGSRLRDQQVRARRLVGDQRAGMECRDRADAAGRAAAVRNAIGPLMQ